MTMYGTIPTTSSTTTTTTNNIDYFSRAKQRITTALTTHRPWNQIFNLNSINFPHTFAESIQRFKTNIAYFQTNYAIIVLIILFLSLLWHPISLIVFVVLMAAWLLLYFLRDEPLVVLDRVVDENVVVMCLFGLTIGLLLFTGVTNNIVSGFVVGVGVVVAHAVVRNTDDLCVANSDSIAAA